MRTTRGALRSPPPVVHDDASDPIPPDDFEQAPRVSSVVRDEAVTELVVCLACGAPPDDGDECAHVEVATLRSPPRAVKSAVTRLQRAMDELQSARRALVGMVPAECALGRAEITVRPPPRPMVTALDARPECPVCIARERSVKRKTLRPVDQQAFAFASGVATRR